MRILHNMIYVLYHGNCYDGFGAAYAAWTKLGEGEHIKYVPCFYADGDSPLEAVEDGSEVYVLDFSFSRKALLAARQRLHSLLVLDHHKTAEASLRGLDFCTFDMQRSGAGLAWDHFHPGTPRPEFLERIEDRDLWRFAFEDTRRAHAGMLSVPMDFKEWDRLKYPGDFKTLLLEGEAILRLQEQQLVRICSRPSWIRLYPGADVIPACATVVYFSEVPEMLLKLHPEARYAAYWYDYETEGGLVRQWGLRSRGDFDVSEVAKRFGGGGHAAASGFIESLSWGPRSGP